MVLSCLVPGSTEGFPSETYRFQPLHCILADVHASGLLHLHVSQVLQGRDGKRECERRCDKKVSCGLSLLKFK